MSAAVGTPQITARDVIERYHSLMGVPVRFVPGDMHALAARYVRAGFTLEDLALVIDYLKRQIKRGEQGERNTGGWNRASLRWGKLFEQKTEGDEGLQRFTELLTLAMAEQPKKVAKAAPAPAATEADDAMRERAVAAMRETKAMLKGGQP